MNNEQQLFNDLKENLEFYYQDLVSYVMWLAENRYYWSSGTSHILPGGRTPEDIVEEIIFKTLNGDRKSYDPSKGTVRYWLRLQAKSIVNALANSATNRRDRELPDHDRLPSTHATSPEDEFIEKENQAAITQEVNVLLAIDDPDLKAIVEVIVLGECEPKPRFLAEALGTDVRDINNRLKRLRRLAKKGETANE